MIRRATGSGSRAMPRQHAAGHAERHGNHDRGERHHGACPLAEDGEVEEGASRQQRKTHAPEAIAERRHDPDHRDPRQRRQELHRRRAASAQRARSRRCGRRGQRHIEDGADRARRVPEGEQAEGCVFHQPLHEARDCLIQSEPPRGGISLSQPGIVPSGRQKEDNRQHGKARSKRRASATLSSPAPARPMLPQPSSCLRGAASSTT